MIVDHLASPAVAGFSVSKIRGQGPYQLDPPQQIWTAVAVDRTHRLYFGTLNGHVLAVDARGSVPFDVDPGESVDSFPALTGDGALVVGSRNGQLVAVD